MRLLLIAMALVVVALAVAIPTYLRWQAAESERYAIGSELRAMVLRHEQALFEYRLAISTHQRIAADILAEIDVEESRSSPSAAHLRLLRTEHAKHVNQQEALRDRFHPQLQDMENHIMDLRHALELAGGLTTGPQP
ncbi:MAG: hypothetical protein EA402_06395 [Planctomycetota bacterium]|nr:MAG: hypothetical protein EA402_06395 [Planctomycetota bacterium]